VKQRRYALAAQTLMVDSELRTGLVVEETFIAAMGYGGRAAEDLLQANHLSTSTLMGLRSRRSGNELGSKTFTRVGCALSRTCA